MAELFGFNITRVRPKTDPKQQFSQPQAEDGTQTVAAGGFFGSCCHCISFCGCCYDCHR